MIATTLRVNGLLLLSVSLALIAAGCGAAGDVRAGRKTVDFNPGWRFAKGDQGDAAGADFDDSAWQTVGVPHDWAAAGPFNPKTGGRTGKLPWRGVGWYRKTFSLDAADRGKRVYFDFDGVMAFPRVYVNGRLAGQWDYGYMSFRVDATDHVKFGEKNVIAVRADTTRHGSRWYPGAGIYRRVVMSVCDPVHVAHWATFVTTPEIDARRATIRVQTTVENHLELSAKASVRVRLLAPSGSVSADGRQQQNIAAGRSRDFQLTLKVDAPQRWDIESPRLYTAIVTVERDGAACDRDIAPFGIRTFRFTADDGFHLNGRRVQLYGVDLHHGHGPLGSAFYPRAMRRKLQIMKDMGANAIRTSHNAPAPQLLALCDRMGMLVMNECFDKWNGTADLLDQSQFTPFMKRQVGNFVRRDRNHPSVVLWSIGNEMWGIEANESGDAPEKVTFMVRQFKRHDPTRPVTMGCLVPQAVGEDTHVLDSLDVTSWNYGRKYLAARKRYPDKPIVYSESASALSTRGYFRLPHPIEKTDYINDDRQVDSYDLNSASGPRDIPDVDFRLMEVDRYVAGEFVWTGFDYLGEPTPYKGPARSSYFGIVDLCGMPKSRYFLYRSHWRPDATTVHILPHWNWPDRLGKNVPVYVYTNGDSAELFLNGKSLGRRKKGVSNAVPENLALARPASASSRDKGTLASHGNDGKMETRWRAADANTGQWWQVDLGKVQPIRACRIVFEQSADRYQYVLRGSVDGENWTELYKQDAWGTRQTLAVRRFEANARYVRIEFTKLKKARAGVVQMEVYASKDLGPLSYYHVIDRYRLRWEDVTYRPGELKAVAYRGGKRLAESVMRTAGPAARIRLAPEWTSMRATGEDLCYVLVEAIDAEGTVCPLADNLITFDVKGPARIAGIGNGNPMGLDPFQDDRHPLFHGKAMLILRSTKQAGAIRVTATADGLKSAATLLQAEVGD